MHKNRIKNDRKVLKFPRMRKSRTGKFKIPFHYQIFNLDEFDLFFFHFQLIFA